MLMQLGNLDTITPEILEALGAAFQVVIENRMQKAPTWHKQFFRDMKTADLAVAIKMLTAPLKLMDWVTDRVVQNIQKRMKTAILTTKECTVGIDRNDVLYASLRAQLPELLQTIGDVVDYWLIDKLHDYLESGHGTGDDYKGIDELPIFSASHPISTDYVAGGVQSNYWSDLDMTGANMMTVETGMKAYKGENGRRMRVKPKAVWHSPNLKSTAINILEKPNLASGESNIYSGRWDRLEIEDLDTDDLWGMWDPNHIAKPFAFMHAIKTKARWLQDPGEKQKQGMYGYDEDVETTCLLWWAISKCVHAS